MINFNSANPVIVCFPSFSGGKFITNCLSLSRHAVPQDCAIAEQLLADPANYQYRFDSIMRTLPPQDDMKNWVAQYEFGDWQLYGLAISDWREGLATTDTASSVVDPLSNSDLTFFICCNSGPESVEKLLQVWPNARLLMLTNTWQFSTVALKLKSDTGQTPLDFAGNYCKEKYEILAGGSWPTWEQFEQVGYNVDRLTDYPVEIQEEMASFYTWHKITKPINMINIDGTIFDQERFLDMIEKLYDWLGFDDFDPKLVAQFWQSYIDLHQIM